jgi:hypothetical protein
MKKITPQQIKFKSQTAITLFSVCALLLLVIAILWPLGTIWALNTLFNLNIAYTFWNWLAATFLIFTIQGALRISKKTIDNTNYGK